MEATADIGDEQAPNAAAPMLRIDVAGPELTGTWSVAVARRPRSRETADRSPLDRDNSDRISPANAIEGVPACPILGS